MKARYSPIAPIQLLHDLHVRGLTNGYYLMLAHDVLENPEHYRRFKEIIVGAGEDPFIIMDNSVVELGTALELERVIEAADIVGASCVMTPDVLGSYRRTQDVVLKHLDALHDCPYELMRVPQGSSIDELFECVDWLRQMLPDTDGIEYWGIPRWVTNKLGSRGRVINYITLEPQAQVHLLGMSNDLHDDLDCTKMYNVMGIDSANPLVLGHNQKALAAGGYKHMDRGTYWDRTAVNEYIIENVMFMHNNVGQHT